MKKIFGWGDKSTKNFKKKDIRIKTNKKKYSGKECKKNNTGDDNLKSQLLKLKTNPKKNSKVTLVPYCNEEIKSIAGISSEYLDNVNRRIIYTNVLKDIKDVFGTKITTNDHIKLVASKSKGKNIKPITTKNKSDDFAYQSPPSSAKKFKKLLKTYIQNNKQIVVTTHSSFLRSFVKEVFNMDKSKVYFDNMDVLRITYNKKNKITTGCVLRWPNYSDKDFPIDPTEKRVFLMRHCAACHNLSKTSIYTKATKDYSGLLSLCLPETSRDMKEAEKGLESMLQGRKTLFLSSIIFRALLTNVLLQQTIQKNATIVKNEYKEYTSVGEWKVKSKSFTLYSAERKLKHINNVKNGTWILFLKNNPKNSSAVTFLSTISPTLNLRWNTIIYSTINNTLINLFDGTSKRSSTYFGGNYQIYTNGFIIQKNLTGHYVYNCKIGYYNGQVVAVQIDLK
jgi:hypothetical protein